MILYPLSQIAAAPAFGFVVLPGGAHSLYKCAPTPLEYTVGVSLMLNLFPRTDSLFSS